MFNDFIKKLALIFTDILLWFAWFPLRGIIKRLPIRLVNSIGQMCGTVLYVFSKIKREIMIKELSFLFSNTSSFTQKKIEKIACRGLQIFSKRQMENLYWGRMSPEIVAEMVPSIDGLSYLEETLKNGKGAILLTAHFGSLLLPPLIFGFIGYKVHQIAGPTLIEKQSLIHRKIFNLRLKESERLPINFIVIGRSARDLFRVLKDNEILFVAFDGREANKMVPVTFFNHKALFSPGPFKLSLKTNAPILRTFIVRQKDDTHRLIIEPPFELKRSEYEEETLALNAEKFAKIFEGYISRYPCHYAMTLMRMEELILEGALKSHFFQN